MHTARANVAIVYLEAEEPEHILSRLAASEHPFDQWFRKQLHRICGLNLELAFMGPSMELVFNWQGPN